MLQMWLVLDNEDDDDIELPLLERQKQSAHSRHVNTTSSSNQTVPSREFPPFEHRQLIHGSLFSRLRRIKPKVSFAAISRIDKFFILLYVFSNPTQLLFKL